MIAELQLKKLDDTHQAACHLADLLVAPMIITLKGEIGAGKTAFVRALLGALGYQGRVKSPTFSIVESYAIPGVSWMCHHFDLYRTLEDELDMIGFRDYFTQDAICLIEWPERAPYIISAVDLCLSFQVRGLGRTLLVDTGTIIGEKIGYQWVKRVS